MSASLAGRSEHPYLSAEDWGEGPEMPPGCVHGNQATLLSFLSATWLLPPGPTLCPAGDVAGGALRECGCLWACLLHKYFNGFISKVELAVYRAC